MKSLLRYLLLIIVMVAVPCHAQFGRLFSSDEDLTSSLVTDVFQDHYGFVWIATSNGLNRYDGSRFFSYHTSSAEGSLSSDKVNSITGDGQRIFVGTASGLDAFDYATNSFHHINIKTGDGKPQKYFVNDVAVLSDGDVIFCASGLGLFRLRNGSSEAVQIPHSTEYGNYLDIAEDRQGNAWAVIENTGVARIQADKISCFPIDHASNIHPTKILADKQGRIFLGTASAGLYEGNGKTFRHVESSGSLPVICLSPGIGGNIFVGTDGSGMFAFDPNTKAITPCNYYHYTADLPHTKVTAAMADRDGNIWMGLFQKGVFMQPYHSNVFGYAGFRSSTHNIIGNKCVMSVFADSRHRLWIGTDQDGLYATDLKFSYSRHFSGKQIPATILCMTEDSTHRLWIGSYLSGCGLFDPSSGSYSQLPATAKGNSIHVFDLATDTQGRVWIATLGDGLKCYNPKTRKLTEFRTRSGNTEKTDMLTNNWVTDLLLSHDGSRLYVGMSMGLTCLDLSSMSFRKAFGRNTILPDVYIQHIYEDAAKTLWVATPKGLYHISQRGDSIRHYTTADGLSDNNICSIQGDTRGNLWIGTSHGLTSLDVKTGQMTCYWPSDGLQGNEYSDRATCSDAGTIVFGGNNGVSWFNPLELKNRRHKLNIYVTDFVLNSQSITTATKSGWWTVTDSMVINSSRFDLSHNDNTFTLRLSAMEYGDPESVRYLYRINDDPWQQLPIGSKELLLSQLAPGTYDISLRAESKGNSSPIRTVKVIVHQPWWLSWWAIALYLAAIAFAVRLYLQYRHRREQDRLRLQEHIHAEQINESKLQFFMNISHEIRTPMTLIIGPLQKLMATDADSDRAKTYQLIYRNAQRILALINQILDIRKIDKGQMRLACRNTDLVGFTKDIYSLFEAKATERNIDFEFRHDADTIPVWIDRQNFDKVLMNLLSNAFKFTPQDGNVTISLTHDADSATITVSDNGIPIDDDKLDKIFNRFYQASNSSSNYVGTGIGLHLTRELVLLHHGNIIARNNADGHGCSFIVTIPLGNSHLKPEEIVGSEEETSESGRPEHEAEAIPAKSIGELNDKSHTARRTVVIAEDDDEIRKYLYNELSADYHVVQAVNGKEALAQVLHYKPDLLLSDVMMPEMDGFTLCTKVKTNINVNDTPVILLTAKTTAEDKLTGLAGGADAYVEKPFNINILKQTIRNLIHMRTVIENKVSGNETQSSKVEQVEVKTPDEHLLERVMKVINANISNPDLSVELVAQEVGISRGHLHRKLKELTNQSPRDFIRNIRLKQAANLLEQGHHNIEEVMYACGFDNASSFSTKFKALYGVSPTAYMNEHIHKSEE